MNKIENFIKENQSLSPATPKELKDKLSEFEEKRKFRVELRKKSQKERYKKIMFKKGDKVFFTDSGYEKIYIVKEDQSFDVIKLKDYNGLYNASHFTLVKEDIPERKYLVFNTDIKDNFKTKSAGIDCDSFD